MDSVYNIEGLEDKWNEVNTFVVDTIGLKTHFDISIDSFRNVE